MGWHGEKTQKAIIWIRSQSSSPSLQAHCFHHKINQVLLPYNFISASDGNLNSFAGKCRSLLWRLMESIAILKVTLLDQHAMSPYQDIQSGCFSFKWERAMERTQQWSWEVTVKTDLETEVELFLCNDDLGISSKVRVKGKAEFWGCVLLMIDR